MASRPPEATPGRWPSGWRLDSFMQLGPVVRRVRTGLFRWPILGQLAVLLLLDLAIHGTLLTQFTGYLAWQNFATSYTASQYPTGPALAWSPFQYGGTEVGLPFANLASYVEAIGPLALFSAWLGAASGAKLYIVLSTWFVGGTALLFARTLIRHPVGQLAAAVFLVAGPFQLALYGQGDYQEFVSEGLIFLSIFALALAVRRPSQRWVWLPVAAWLMVFTFQTLQAFLLGLVLLACLLPVLVRDARISTGLPGTRNRMPSAADGATPSAPNRAETRWRTVRRSLAERSAFLKEVGGYWARLPALVAVAAVIAIPAYFTFYLLGSGASAASSNVALPISVFSSYSRDPALLLTLGSYFNLNSSMVAGGAGGASSLFAWNVLTVALLALVWLGYLYLRDSRLVYLLVLTVLAALIGAGPEGPLSPLSLFLYLRFPGYAALNASYYWDWFIIAPLDALMLGVLLEGLLTRRRSPAPSPGPTPSPSRGVRSILRQVREAPSRPEWPRVTRVLAVTLLVLLSAVVVLPLANGAYYSSPNGIHETSYPTDYRQIPGLLDHLIGSSYAGVALFNPDVNWFLNNSTRSVPNAFFLYPTVRTPGLPVYLAPTLRANAYYYWLYQEFYSNTTRYAGALFALAGVEYFLVFYGTQSASFYPNFLPASYGKNASQLFEYQADVAPVVQARDFAIYRNLAFNGVALSDSTFSLVAGPGYDELNALAYAGVGLANQSWLFASDLPANACSSELARVDRVYAASPNALLGVPLECDHVSVADPSAETSPVASPSQSWVPSTDSDARGLSIAADWPETLAVTVGDRIAFQVPISTGGCAGDCRLWLPVRLSGDGGTLVFGWQGSSWTLPTNRSWGGVNNTMGWVELPFPVGSAGSLSVTSSGGWDAIGDIYVFSGGPGAPNGTPFDWLNQSLARVTLLGVTPAYSGAITPFHSGAGRLKYFTPADNDSENSYPGGVGILATRTGGGPVTVPLAVAKPAGPGWLALLARSTGPVFFNVTFGANSTPEWFGIGGGLSAATNSSWQTILVPWNSSTADLSATASVGVVNGTIWLAQAWFLPGSIAGTGLPNPIDPPPSGSPTVTTSNGAVITNYTVTASSRGVLSLGVRGTFGPSSTFGLALANFSFPGPAPPGYEIAVSVDVTPGLGVSVAGATVGYQGLGNYTWFGSVRSSPVSFSIAAYSSFPAPSNGFVVEVEFAFVVLPGTWNVSDFAGPPLEVSADDSGYSVQTNGSALVLVRVADYSGLAVDGGASLGSALGTLATLVWNPSNSSEVTVSPESAAYFTLGLEVSGAATVVWVVVELWIRRRRGRLLKADPRTV